GDEAGRRAVTRIGGRLTELPGPARTAPLPRPPWHQQPRHAVGHRQHGGPARRNLPFRLEERIPSCARQFAPLCPNPLLKSRPQPVGSIEGAHEVAEPTATPPLPSGYGRSVQVPPRRIEIRRARI